MRVVCVLSIREHLHHPDGVIVIRERSSYLALYFPPRGDLKDRSRPPALRLGGNHGNSALENPGDRVGAVWEVENALACALLGIDDDAVGSKRMRVCIRDHQREAGGIDYGSNCLVDLAICFL